MWLDLVLLGQAAVLGLWGSVHCAAMCGPLCAVCLPPDHEGSERQGRTSTTRVIGWIRPLGLDAAGGASPFPAGLVRFLGARALSYGVLGVLISASAGWLRDMALLAAWIKPVWLGVHLVLLLGGAWMIITGRWVDQAGPNSWLGQRIRQARQTSSGQSRWRLGFLWGLWPCGVLYGALMLAALTNHPLLGGVAMVVFSVASAPGLAAGVWWIARARAKSRVQAAGLSANSTEVAGSRITPAWLVRTSGGVIALGALWALAHDALTTFVAWCVT